jgi:hypothetical protein
MSVQHEVFGRDLTDAHAAGHDLIHRGGFRLGDGGGRAVDGQDMTGGKPGCDRSRGRSGAAPDFENAQVRLERKRLHDRGEPG